jgi:hypothetical protein
MSFYPKRPLFRHLCILFRDPQSAPGCQQADLTKSPDKRNNREQEF